MDEDKNNVGVADDILEYMSNQIQDMLSKKTGIEWTVTCQSEHLDFQFTAKSQIEENPQYGIRSASFSMLELSEVTVPLMITSTVQLMIAHFSRAKEHFRDS